MENVCKHWKKVSDPYHLLGVHLKAYAYQIYPAVSDPYHLLGVHLSVMNVLTVIEVSDPYHLLGVHLGGDSDKIAIISFRPLSFVRGSLVRMTFLISTLMFQTPIIC